MIELTMKFYVVDTDDPTEGWEVVADINDLVGGGFDNVLGDDPATIRLLTPEEAAEVQEGRLP